MRIEFRSPWKTGLRRQIPQLTSTLALLALAGAPVGGCSIALPGSTASSGLDYEATGSIAKPQAAPASQPSPVSKRLDAEDWRRARAALGVALDPQGDGAPVAWNNPQSGRRGTFAAVAAPYPVDGQVCRAFIARIDGEPREQVQGSACRTGGTDEWDVSNVKAFKDG